MRKVFVVSRQKRRYAIEWLASRSTAGHVNRARYHELELLAACVWAALASQISSSAVAGQPASVSEWSVVVQTKKKREIPAELSLGPHTAANLKALVFVTASCIDRVEHGEGEVWAADRRNTEKAVVLRKSSAGTERGRTLRTENERRENSCCWSIARS